MNEAAAVNCFNDFIDYDVNNSHICQNDFIIASTNRYSVLGDVNSGGPPVDDISSTSVNNHKNCISNGNTCRNDYVYSKLKKVTKQHIEGLTIGHLNVRSLLPKIEQIRHLLDNTKFDIFCINESWLDSSISYHEIEVTGYKMFNKPRNRHGGGVAIYIRNDLKYKRRIDLELANIECIWLEVVLHKTKLLLCSLYRPPSMGNDYYNNMLDCIEKACFEDKLVVLIGDLNINYIIDESLSSNPLYYIECANNLKQLVESYTRVTPTSKSTIDVILSSHPELHTCTDVYEIALSDHYLIYTSLDLTKSKKNVQAHKHICYRSYKNFNDNDFIHDVQYSNEFANVLHCSDVTTAWSIWKNEFLRIANVHAPIKNSRLKNRYNPWIDNDIVKRMYYRDYLHKLMIKNPSIDIKNEYKSVRNEVNCMINNAKLKYYDKLYNEGRTNGKILWKELKKLSGSKHTENEVSEFSAEDFNSYFSSVGLNVTNHFPDNGNLLWKGPDSIYNFKFNKVCTTNVLKLLNGLSSTSSLDILTFDCKLLTLSSHIIVESLTHIFNLSLMSGIIPDDWKHAKVTPVFKGSGSTHEITNYRPISVIGHIAKIIQKEVQCQLMSFLIEHQFITLDQYAYRKFHSTTNCLHVTVDEWLQNMDDKLLTGVCFLDIAKCFDTINHEILLKKLGKYGIRNSELYWFQSYLSNRSQSVNYCNNLSGTSTVNIGVPQGSTLGPLLFVLFVNDLPMHIKNARCTMYADDTIIYVNGDKVSEANDLICDTLATVNEWYIANKLVLNVNKCNAMLISPNNVDLDNDFEVILNGRAISNVHFTKYLGVIVDSQLKFHCNINELVKKLSQKIAWLGRLRHIVTAPVLSLVYHTYIQPIFDYCCTVWGCNAVNINAIQKLQNRAARIITSNFDIINVRGEDLVKQLKWQTIDDRIKYFLNIQMYQAIHGNSPDYLCNSIVMACESNDLSTRSHNTLNVEVPFCRTDVMKRSFIYRGSKLWNNLPDNVQNSESVNVFKHNLKTLK